MSRYNKPGLSDRLKEFKIVKLLGVIFIAIILLQFLALVLENWIPQASAIKTGSIFILFGVAICILFAFYLLFQREGMQKEDVIIMIVLAATTIFLLFYLKPLLPEIFKQSAQSLINIIGGWKYENQK